MSRSLTPFLCLTPPVTPLHYLGIYGGMGVMMGMRSPPAGGEPNKRMNHPRAVIKTGAPGNRCAVAVGGHRLLTPL